MSAAKVSPVPPSARRRVGRLLLGAAAALAALAALVEGLHLTAGNWYLRNRLAAQISRNPDRMRIEWSEAFSPWPGKATVRDLRIRGRNRRVEWHTTVDRAEAFVAPLALLGREFRASRVRATGVAVRVRLFPTREERPQGSLHAPPIPGLPDPPVLLAQRPPERPRKKNPWRYSFEDVEVRDLREVWIEDRKLLGNLAARGRRIVIRPRRELLLEECGLQSEGALLARAGQIATEDLTGSVVCSIRGFDWSRQRGRQMLAHMDLDARFSGRLHSLPVREFCFGDLNWIVIREASGRASVDLRIDQGRVQPGSRAQCALDFLEAEYLGRSVSGAASAEVEVGDAGRPGPARFDVRFDDFAVRFEGAGQPHLFGTGLDFSALAPELRLTGLPTGYRFEARMEEMRTADLTAYNRILGESSPLRLVSGDARMAAYFQGSEAGGQGAMRMQGERLSVLVDGIPVRGDLDLQSAFDIPGWGSGVYDLSGTTVDIRRVQAGAGREAADRGDWWARIALPEARATGGAGGAFEARAEVEMRDTWPLLVYMGSRGGFLKLLRGFADIRDVEGTGLVRVGPGTTRAEGVRFTGKGFALRACFDFGGKGANRGVLWADRGMLAAGVGFGEGETRVKPFARESWFAGKEPYCRTGIWPSGDPGGDGPGPGTKGGTAQSGERAGGVGKGSRGGRPKGDR